MHGYCGNGKAGTMQYEIYDNVWTLESGKFMFRWIFIRGGTGVVYNNTLTSQQSGQPQREIDISEYRLAAIDSCYGAAKSCCTSYPCLDQIGRGQDQALDPVYFWNNTVNGVAATVSVNPVGSLCEPTPDINDYIQISRDYYVGTLKPGYIPYEYPHPLVIPQPPRNLRITSP